MKLAAAAVVCLVAVAAAGSASAQQSCCSSDSDCTDQMSPEDIEYNGQFDKTLECDQSCPGVVNCNMFGICEQCRGCFESCEGAMKFMEVTSLSADVITFCSGTGIADVSECDGDGGSASGAGSAADSTSGGASGSGSGSGSGSSGAASGSGLGSASGGTSTAYGSAGGSGAGSGSGSASSASGSGSGTNSGSTEGSTGFGSGAGSGSGSSSMETGSGSGSGDASRIADIPGCDCGSAEVEEGYAAFLCDNGKSLYCDLECLDDADPANVLIPGFGGLWCSPQDWLGCRLCKMDCSDYAGLDCVPCPTGVKNWC
ncbi:unnamed protein product [Pylaiella littoralis]